MHSGPVAVPLAGRWRRAGRSTVRALVLKVLLQVVERLGRTALGRRLLGLAARMVRGLMMRLMVRLMMWWRWLMVLGVLLLLLLGRLRMYAASSRRTGRHTLDLPRSAGTAGRRWPALALLRLLYMIIYMARAGSTRAAGLLRVRWSPGAWRLVRILVRRVLRVGRWRWSPGTHVVRHPVLSRIAAGRRRVWRLRTPAAGRTLGRLGAGRWRWPRHRWRRAVRSRVLRTRRVTRGRVW